MAAARPDSELSDREYQTEQQRYWRNNSGKTKVEVYLEPEDLDTLDWLAYRLIAVDKKIPSLVGRPAAVRQLLRMVGTAQSRSIKRWLKKAPDPAARTRFYQQELGRRRRGPNYDHYSSLPPERQQEILRSIIIHRAKESTTPGQEKAQQTLHNFLGK